MYEPPIRVDFAQVTSDIGQEVSEEFDRMVLQATFNAGVTVDRDELVRALTFDRGQYEKGYADGKADAWGWVSVKDRLPDTQHIMLVCTRNRNGVPKVAMASYHDGFGWCGSGGRWGNVTHWMPLPEPPKEDA